MGYFCLHKLTYKASYHPNLKVLALIEQIDYDRLSHQFSRCKKEKCEFDDLLIYRILNGRRSQDRFSEEGGSSE